MTEPVAPNEGAQGGIQSFFLIGSNIVMILPISAAFYFKEFYIGTQLTLTMIFSTLYHICDSTGYCFFGDALSVWKLLDYIFAFWVIVLIFLFMADFRITGSEGPTFTTQSKWWSITQSVYPAILILLILANPFTKEPAYIIIMIGAMLLYGKFIIIDYGYVNTKRFEGVFLLTGLTLFAIGVVFFSLDSGEEYWIFHSLWHICAFLGMYYFILAGKKQKENWKKFVHRAITTALCCIGYDDDEEFDGKYRLLVEDESV